MAREDRHDRGSRDLDPGGFGRESVHGSTYDRGGYGREAGSGRNYPGSRGRREPGYSRGPYAPGPADTGYGQHETGRGAAPDPAGYEPGGYGTEPAPRGYRRRDYEGGRYEDIDQPPRREPGGGTYERRYGDSWTVPGPHVGRGPEGYVRSDERMMEEVCERLTWNGEIDASDVRVTVDNGEVTLEGTVDDRRAKRMADELAASVRGVYDVHNHLRIPRMNEPADEHEEEKDRD